MNQIFEIAIIGAGPGGLGAATNAADHKISHILFEKREVGNTVFDYQLRKLVMAEPRRLPLRAYVTFEEGSREEILANFNKAVTDKGVNLCKTTISKIEKVGDIFHLHDGKEVFQAKKVVLAVGNMGAPRKLGVTGEDLPHIAYTLADPDAFNGMHITVVGAGDAAIENALALKDKNIVSLINLRSEFPRAKDANRKKILDAIKKQEIRCFYDTTIKECRETELTINTPEGEVVLPCNHAIVRIGNLPPRAFIESCGIAFTSAEPDAYPKVNDTYESNVPGLYIIGALIGYPLIKQALNQGHEVVEHILGNPIEPADTPLIEEVVAPLGFPVNEALAQLRGRLPLFAELSAPQFREMLLDSKIHVLDQGEVVFEKDAHGDTFWSVVSGSVDINSPVNPEQSFNLGQGNFFGEMGLISGRPRAATIVSHEEQTVLLETKRNQVLKLIGSCPSLKHTIDANFFLRIIKTSVFPEISAAELAELVSKSEQKQFNKGEVLFQEGDPADALYIILKGSVKVSKRNFAGVNVAQTYLSAGNYVGEMALLSNSTRSATVSAAVRCETLKISKEQFDLLLKNNPKTAETMELVSRQRMVENITAAQSAESGELLDFVLQQGISDADNVLLIDSDLCVGCDNCEKACAATHDGFSRLDRKRGKSFASLQVPISCRHCENPLCMLDCPPDALMRMPSGEVVIKDTCIGCGNCASNCPYGVIQLVYKKAELPWWDLRQLFQDAKKKGGAKAAKCDMCTTLPSGPACVRSCPTGAAMRLHPKEMFSLISKDDGDS